MKTHILIIAMALAIMALPSCCNKAEETETTETNTTPITMNTTMDDLLKIFRLNTLLQINLMLTGNLKPTDAGQDVQIEMMTLRNVQICERILMHKEIMH